MDASLRHALLGLLEALVALPAAGLEDASMRAARANGRTFVEAGGLELAVDLIAGVIFSSLRPPVLSCQSLELAA